MSLFDVKHQEHAQRSIQRALIADRLPHAYVFHGPPGVGKEALAQGLAQVLLCGQPVEKRLDGGEARSVGLDSLRIGCGECDDCRLAAAQTHPDLHIIYRQLNREHPDPVVRSRKGLEIGVDVLRHFVIERIGLTPARGRAKLFIIREADRITAAAQNALLKTLEEPPGVSVLILLVSALDRLLPTTRSRCQVVRFDALPADFVQRKLTELLPDLPPEQVEWYARCADGSLGLALERAADGLYALNQRVLEALAEMPGQRTDHLAKMWTDESKALGEGYRKRDPDITDTEAGRRGFKSIFHLAATWYADLLRCGSGDPAAIVNAALHDRIEHAAQALDAARAADAIYRIVQADRQLDLNANTQLCLETLLDDLAHIARHKPLPTA